MKHYTNSYNVFFGQPVFILETVFVLKIKFIYQVVFIFMIVFIFEVVFIRLQIGHITNKFHFLYKGGAHVTNDITYKKI